MKFLRSSFGIALLFAPLPLMQFHAIFHSPYFLIIVILFAFLAIRMCLYFLHVMRRYRVLSKGFEKAVLLAVLGGATVLCFVNVYFMTERLFLGFNQFWPTILNGLYSIILVAYAWLGSPFILSGKVNNPV